MGRKNWFEKGNNFLYGPREYNVYVSKHGDTVEIKIEDLLERNCFWDSLLDTSLGNMEDVAKHGAHKHDILMFFSDRASWIDYILITNLMHQLLFIHKILFSSTCFEPQVLIFRRIQLYTCSIWYCHSLWEFLVACRYTAWVRTHSSCVPTGHHELWQYHMLYVYNCILLKMSTWGSKHVEENSIVWINNNQCIKLVINV